LGTGVILCAKAYRILQDAKSEVPFKYVGNIFMRKAGSKTKVNQNLEVKSAG
jgi:hypothetical protein